MRQVVDHTQMLFLLANHTIYFLIIAHFRIFFTKSTFSVTARHSMMTKHRP